MLSKKMDITSLNILLIDDDEIFNACLLRVFKFDGYITHVAKDFKTASALIDEIIGGKRKFDIILLDLKMPDGSGYDLLARIQKYELDMPVMVLSSNSSEADRVACFDLGADDYLCKPFILNELRARIKAVVRRYRKTSDKTEASDQDSAFVFRHGGLLVNLSSDEVVVDGARIKLRYIELSILKAMIFNKNVTISRDRLIELVWGDKFIDDKSLAPHISRLKKKLGSYGKLIENESKIGYRFCTCS